MHAFVPLGSALLIIYQNIEKFEIEFVSEVTLLLDGCWMVHWIVFCAEMHLSPRSPVTPITGLKSRLEWSHLIHRHTLRGRTARMHKQAWCHTSAEQI